MRAARIADILLAAGAAARLTRFVVTEDLGRWLIRDPANRWAWPPGADTEHPVTVPQKLVSGLECPFCVGQWLQLGFQAANAILPAEGRIRGGWRVLTISLAATWVAGHVGSRLGDAGYSEE